MSMKRRITRTVQRERRILHGDYMTVNIFPVFSKAGSRRKKSKPTSEVQEKLNQIYREERLTYLINTNFTTKDLEIGLGFDDEHLPEDYAGVQRYMRNYIRRVKRLRKKLGLPDLKYIYVIERGEINGRWHVHMIMSGGVDRDTLEELWRAGYAHTYRLEFDDEGLKGLAKYKVKEPENETEMISGKVRRWAASKNLKQPTVKKDRDGFISRETVKDIREGNVTEREIERLYPGYTITEWTPRKNSVNAGEYLIIRLRKTQSSRITKQIFGGGKTHRRQ